MSIGAIKQISFSSMLKIEDVKNKVVNEVGLLNRDNDEWIKPYLHALGMETKRQVQVNVAKHRNLDGEIVVGYMYTGFERTDRAWRNSKYCTMAGYIEGNKDPYLKADLYNAARQGIGAAGWEAMCMGAVAEAAFASAGKNTKMEYEEDYLQVSEQLDILKELLINVRGRNSDFE